MAATHAEDIEVGSFGPTPAQITFDSVSIDVPVKDVDGKSTVKSILSDVSGVFGPGELVAVMGPSGSGKTTMLNALTGVMTPTSGTIHVNGLPIDQSVMRRFMALVPQDDLLTPVLTPREALLDAAAFKTKLTLEEAKLRTTELLAKFGLEGCADVVIGHPEGEKGISGGQKKRLSVALELMGSPSLLFLDACARAHTPAVPALVGL